MNKVELLNVMGSDLDVVNAARVSFNKENFTFQDKDEKLIEYLAKNKHKSPFNHAFLKFRVSAPVFVARQLVKHEYLVWNEVSRRYVDSNPCYFLPEEWRKRADNVKQGSSEDVCIWLNREERISSRVLDLYEQIDDLYTEMLEAGVCPEQARMILPQSMMTEWIWSGSLYAFTKMVILRKDAHAQKETREIAALIGEHLFNNFPFSYSSLIKHGV